MAAKDLPIHHTLLSLVLSLAVILVSQLRMFFIDSNCPPNCDGCTVCARRDLSSI